MYGFMLIGVLMMVNLLIAMSGTSKVRTPRLISHTLATPVCVRLTGAGHLISLVAVAKTFDLYYGSTTLYLFLRARLVQEWVLANVATEIPPLNILSLPYYFCCAAKHFFRPKPAELGMRVANHGALPEDEHAEASIALPGVATAAPLTGPVGSATVVETSCGGGDTATAAAATAATANPFMSSGKQGASFLLDGPQRKIYFGTLEDLTVEVARFANMHRGESKRAEQSLFREFRKTKIVLDRQDRTMSDVHAQLAENRKAIVGIGDAESSWPPSTHESGHLVRMQMAA